jgi:hypothetical protein
MEPINFHKKEQIIDRTDIPGVDYKLPVVCGKYQSGEPIIISCWKVNLRDILKIIFTRKIYVSFLSENIPLIAVSTSLEEIGIEAPQDL